MNQKYRASYIKWVKNHIINDDNNADKTFTEKEKLLRQLKEQVNQLNNKRKSLSQKIYKDKAQSSNQQYVEEAQQAKQEAQALEEKSNKTEQELYQIALAMPNIKSKDIPQGNDATQNKIIEEIGNKPQFAFKIKSHYDIGPKMGMNFELARQISGSRFVILNKNMARLERALINFMLDLHIEKHHYTETTTPVLVNKDAMINTGQLPKFYHDQFHTTNDYWLIPTAEVTLTNHFVDKIFNLADLPIRLVANSLCFRAEAGAAGRDTRGLIRQHQFTKIELVSATLPEHSEAELEKMLKCAETILRLLELPYRVVLLCTGDTGFSANKTYDIEVWMPAKNDYVEISSCSNTKEFQAARMGARYKNANKKINYIHTLNGSALAVGRLLAAIIENYQNKDGSVNVPEVLLPYMGSINKITPN